MNVLVKEGILGAILLIMGVFDRLYIDWYWGGPHQSVNHPRHRGPDALHAAKRQRGQTRKLVAWGNRVGGIAALRCRPIYNADGTMVPQSASLTAPSQREPFARHCHKSFIIYTIHPR